MPTNDPRSRLIALVELIDEWCEDKRSDPPIEFICDEILPRLQTVIAALPSRREETPDGWQPIETHDGTDTPVLVWDGFDQMVSWYRGGDWRTFELCAEAPTHWRTLSPPPKTQDAASLAAPTSDLQRGSA